MLIKKAWKFDPGFYASFGFYLCHLNVLPLYAGEPVMVQAALSPITSSSINFGTLVE
jgi:hypothetical protein